MERQLAEAQRPLVGLFETRPPPPPRKERVDMKPIRGIPQETMSVIIKCVRDLEKKGSRVHSGGALIDLVIAMILKKNCVNHKLIYGVLTNDDPSSSRTILTLAVFANDLMVNWPGFTIHTSLSFDDKEILLNMVKGGKIEGNRNAVINSIERTFEHAISLNNEVVIPPENYDKLLQFYIKDHSISRMVKRLRRDGYF